MPESSRFSLDRLSYWYPDSTLAALREVTLRIDGGVTAVTGASGCGKSTLLRTCNGLVPHFHGGRVRGSATLCGRDVLRTPTRLLARHAGFLFQDPELQAVHATVERDVAFGLENLGVPPREMRCRVEEALRRTGAWHLRSRAVHTLSGGERQRCALAGVLALRPALLALDEPLSQLDDDGVAALLAHLAELRDQGVAVLVAEHRLRALRTVCDTTLHMHDSRLAAAPEEDPLSVIGPRADRREGDVIAWQLQSVVAGHRGAAVLHDLDISGACGEVVALLGRNGAGKTTVMRTVAGLLPPLAGSVMRLPGRIAYLPQHPAALLHRATVADEVAWTLRHDGGGGSVDTLLAELRVLHVRNRYPRDLSTGEQQRAALAAVLAGTPSLALLDEPTRGMDGAGRRALIAAVARLRDSGCAVLIATHDRELAAAVADRTLLVADGSVRTEPVQAATPVTV